MNILILLILIGMGFFVYIEFILSKCKNEMWEEILKKWSVLFEHQRNEHQRTKRVHKQSKK